MWIEGLTGEIKLRFPISPAVSVDIVYVRSFRANLSKSTVCFNRFSWLRTVLPA